MLSLNQEFCFWPPGSACNREESQNTCQTNCGKTGFQLRNYDNNL